MAFLEKENYKYGITIGISWLIFCVWEVFVFLWATDINGAIIRIDLMLILPALILLTAYCLWQIIKNNVH